MKSVSASSVPEEQVTRGERQSGARGKHRHTYKTTLIFWGFVGPLVLGLIIFFYIPIVWSLILSFGNARATLVPTSFVGLQNYSAMLHDPAFVQALITFTIFALFIVPITFVCSLGLAVLVNSVKVAQGFFRSVFFLPT